MSEKYYLRWWEVKEVGLVSPGRLREGRLPSTLRLRAAHRRQLMHISMAARLAFGPRIPGGEGLVRIGFRSARCVNLLSTLSHNSFHLDTTLWRHYT
jgi:hypothetical protein